MAVTTKETEKRLLVEIEIEREYGLKRSWLRRCRLERRGPKYLKIGRSVRYRRTDIEDFFAAHVVETKE